MATKDQNTSELKALQVNLIGRLKGFITQLEV
jgi:hypothetical protein